MQKITEPIITRSALISEAKETLGFWKIFLYYASISHPQICACFGLALALFFAVYTSYAAHYVYGFGGDVRKAPPGHGRSRSLGHSALGLSYSDPRGSSYSVAVPAIAKTMPTDHDAAAVTTVTDYLPVTSYTSTPPTSKAAQPVSSYTATPAEETSVATYHAEVVTDAPVNNYGTDANVTSAATYEAVSGDSSAILSTPVLAVTEVTAYAAAPSATERAVYPSTPDASYAAAPVGTGATPFVASELAVRYTSEITTTTVPQAETTVTTASTAPFVACYGVPYVAICVPRFGIVNAGPVCGYNVGALGYYGGQCDLFFNQ